MTRDEDTFPTLAEMRERNLPKLTAADVFNGDLSDEERSQLDEYLSAFMLLGNDGECPRCETRIGGMLGMLIGGFQWGLVHGEGYCNRCRWPIRAYHFPKEGPIERFELLLPYHPNALEERE